MSTAPRLTVAIPTYNGARHVSEALRSILAQEPSNFDLIISDDRSDDDTIALARAEAGDRARVVVNTERLGLAGNWNQCVALSRTPWVAVFHQDDIMRPGHLAVHAAAMASAPDPGMIASAADVIDADGRAVPPAVVVPGRVGDGDHVFAPGEFVSALAASNPVRCSGVTLLAKAHAAVGGFDPSYRYVVDWHCWLRIARGWSVAWLAAPTVAVRWHPASETHRFKTGTVDLDEAARLLTDIFETDAARLADAPRLRRAAHRGLARAFLNRAHVALKAGDPALARRCLHRAVSLSPAILTTIAADPKLAGSLAALLVAPRAAARWFGGEQAGR